MNSSLLRLGTTFDMSSHILQNHNSIVHHITNSNRQTGKWNNIQRPTLCYRQINERGNQWHRNGNTNNYRGAPTPQENKHNQHHKEYGIHNGFRQTVDGIQNIIRCIDNYPQFHVTGKWLLQLRQLFHHLFGNIYRIGSRLFLNNNHGTLHTIIIRFLRTLFHRVYNLCHITQIDRCTVVCTHYNICHLARIFKFSLHTQWIGITTHIKRTSRSIFIFGTDNRTDCFNSQIISIQFIRVTIDIHLSLGCTGNRYSTHTWNTCQRIHHIIIQNLIKCRLAFFRLNGKQQDRNHVRTELEDNRCVHFIGKLWTHHVQLIANIIGKHIDVVAIFKFQCNHRDIFGRLWRDMFQITHRVQRIFQRASHIIFYIGSTGTLIRRHYHDGIGINIRVQVYRKFRQWEKTKDCYRKEAKWGHNRFLDCSFV